MGGEHEECNMKGVKVFVFLKNGGGPIYGPFFPHYYLEYLWFPHVSPFPSASNMHMTVLASLSWATKMNKENSYVHVTHFRNVLIQS